MATTEIRAEARLRAKSQLTLPDVIVTGAGIEPGDRFLVEVSIDEPDTIRLHRIRESYAGALQDVYGKAADYLAEERASWERG